MLPASRRLVERRKEKESRWKEEDYKRRCAMAAAGMPCTDRDPRQCLHLVWCREALASPGV